MGDRSAHLIRIILIASLTFIAYSNSFNSAFHFDDYSSIIAHPYIKSIHNIPYFFYYNGSPLTNRPVTMATFALNFGIGGLDPFSYHVVNFFIHLVNAILVYILLLLTLRNRINEYMNVSLLASLMFAVHPIQTQAVTYIVQRAEILSSFFYLLSLVLFIKARLMISQKSEVRSQKSKLHATRYTLYAISIISAILAMGSKEIAVTLPVTIIIYDFFFISDGNIKTLSKRWAIHLLFFLTLLPLMYFMGVSQFSSFVSTDAVQSPPTSSIYAETPSISRYDYLFTQFRVIWNYIGLLILPVNQNLDYNYPVSKGLFDPLTTLFGGIGIIALLSLALFLFKRMRLISFFIFWFFLILAPTSSVAVLPDVIFEHRLYLSSLGFFVIFALGVFKASDIIFKIPSFTKRGDY